MISNPTSRNVSYRHTVAAIVYKDDPVLDRRMYLAVQKPQWDKNEWSVVQGGLEEHGGEEHVALDLELSEELGTKKFGVPKEMPQYFYRQFTGRTKGRYPERSGYIGKKIKYFHVEYKGLEGEIMLGAELSSFRWMPRDEFLSSVKYVNELQKVLDHMEGIPVKTEVVGLERRVKRQMVAVV